MEWFSQILDSGFWQAILLAVLTGIGGRLLVARGKLIWSVSHQHYYSLPRLDEDGSFPVRTQQIWFQNVGRASIEDIEIILNWRPQHFEIWNPRQHTLSLLPDGRLVISIPNLSGYEAFTLSIIDTFRDLPVVLNVRWKSGLGKQINMFPQRAWPQWVILIGTAAMLIGITAVLYGVLQGVLWVIAEYSAAQPSG